jgi:hypothetical protein
LVSQLFLPAGGYYKAFVQITPLHAVVVAQDAAAHHPVPHLRKSRKTTRNSIQSITMALW